MTLLKRVAVRVLPLANEQLWGYLSFEILWQLLDGRSPFSLWGYLLSGALVVGANTLFLRRRRSIWAVLVLNGIVCFVWVPLLARTLDRTYAILIYLQILLFLLLAIRGYQHSTRTVTVLRLQNCGEMMAIFCLFYLIVASFVPALMVRVPLALAVLLLDMLAVVLLRTTGRNTVRAGGRGSLVPTLLIFAALGAAAAAAGTLLVRGRDWILTAADRAGDALAWLILAVWNFWQSLFKPRELAPVTTVPGQEFQDVGMEMEMVRDTPLVRRIMLGVVAVCLVVVGAVLLWSLLQWLWQSRHRAVWPGDDDETLSRSALPRRGLLARALGALRIGLFLLRRQGTPRAALLQLELWGAMHHCRRHLGETPREYLQRLRQTRLETVLSADMNTRYDHLLADVEAVLYGDAEPHLTREEVRELLAAAKQGRQT